MSVITKIFLFIMISSILFVTITINLIIDSERTFLMNVLVDKKTHNEEIYSKSVSSLLFDLDKDNVETTLHSLYNDRDIVEIRLIDYSDTINLTITDKKYLPKNSIGSTSKLHYDNLDLGELTIIYTIEHVEEILETFQEKIIVVSFSLVFFLLAIILYYMNYVTKSLTILSHATKEIADGNLDYPISINNNDEIGQLAKRFISMRDSLKERIETIHDQLIFQQNLIDNVNTPIYYKDLNKKYIGCNKAFEELLQLKKTDILNKNISEILNQDMADYYTSKDDILLQDNIRQEYESEIKFKNGTIKNLVFYKNTFTENEHVAGIIGVVFDITERKLFNNRLEMLNTEIKDTQKEILFKLGAVAETRSKETGMHIKRVAEYSKLLATFYGLSEDEIETIKMASPMHDIGKIGIPDDILNKPGRYTPEEFEIMKQHAKIGYDMLKDSNKPLVQASAIIAHQHQEKYDGTGYPQELKGEEIHIYGRITALADVFDALGSERVYKKAWKDERIFEFFKNQSGKHFDPVLIDIFFKHLDKFLKIRDTFKDVE